MNIETLRKNERKKNPEVLCIWKSEKAKNNKSGIQILFFEAGKIYC